MNEQNQVSSYSAGDLDKIKGAWLGLIEKAKTAKEDFNSTATSILKYYAKDAAAAGNYDGYSEQSQWFSATINKTFEAVKIFGPALYEQNPVRLVTARNAGDPFPEVLNKFLNYTTVELDRRRHARMAIDETLIKGAGIGWTEMDAHTGLVYSAYKSIDDLLLDPDARCPEDIWWLALRCREPIWNFKRMYGDAAKDVKPSGDDGTKSDSKESQSQDYVTYWKIFSKMGDGLRVKKETENTADDGANDRSRDFKYIIIAPEGKPVFIGNWPTPFWADARTMGWPCALLDFAREPNSVWPIPILKAGLPLQKWINWAYTFLLKKVKITCRDIGVANKRLSDENKAVIRNDAITDFQMMYLDDPNIDDIRKVFQTIQFPAMNGDLLKAIEMAELQFQKVTGLYEILYGQTPQAYRSAQEAIVKDRNSRLRIDDMGREVVMWENINSRHEAICARMHMTPEMIGEILGPEAAQIWGYYKQGDLLRVMREYQYTIETGSLKPLGPNEMVEQTNLALQTLAPMYAQAAAWQPLNRLIADWAKYRQIAKPEELMIPLAPMNGQMVTPAQQQAAEAQQAEVARQQAALEQQQLHDKTVQEAEGEAAATLDLVKAREGNQTKLQTVQMKGAIDLQKAQMQAKVAMNRPKPAGGGK